MDGPPLLDCTHYSEVLQGDAAPCSGLLGPREKTYKLLDAYLRVPILEAEKRELERKVELSDSLLLDAAPSESFWTSPPFIIMLGSVALVAGVLIGTQID